MLLIFNLVDTPPSDNSLRSRRGGGMYRTKEYHNWMESAVLQVRSQGGRIEGDVKIVVEVTRPDDRRRRDLTNYTKALCDLLQAAGVVGDDSAIVDFRIAWVYRASPAVSIYASSAAHASTSPRSTA